MPVADGLFHGIRRKLAPGICVSSDPQSTAAVLQTLSSVRSEVSDQAGGLTGIRIFVMNRTHRTITLRLSPQENLIRSPRASK